MENLRTCFLPVLHACPDLVSDLGMNTCVVQVYSQLFRTSASTPPDFDPEHASIFKSCWLLFLHVRDRTGCTDMVPGFFLLVSCLDVILNSAPEAVQNSISQAHTPGMGITEILCTVSSCKMDHNMRNARKEVHEAISDLLARGLLTGSFDGNEMFSEEQMEANLASLRSVAPAPSLPGGADGCILLEAFDLVGLMRPSEFHAATTAEPATAAQAGSESSHLAHNRNELLKTPERPVRSARPVSAPPITPVTRALRSHEWLDTFISDQPTCPQAALESFFNACSHGSPAAAIAQHVKDAESRLLDSVKGQTFERDSARSVEAGTRLFYKALLYILQREEKRLLTRDFSVLLRDEGMHRALLAVSHEIATHAYQSHTRPHPAVQRALAVTCFDLLVMIENFLRDFEVFLVMLLLCVCVCVRFFLVSIMRIYTCARARIHTRLGCCSRCACALI
jgi:hypothetical protein